MRLPVVPEEITREWLTAALRERHPGVNVTDVRVVDVLQGTSTKIRVHASYDRAGENARLPQSLIVKGGFESHSPSMKEMYRNEMRFYRDVLPHVAILSPACYYAGSDPDSHQSIVILEDLCTRGIRFLHAQQPQNEAQVARRLEAMARYHAQSWDSPEFRAGGRFDWIGGRHEGWSLVYQDRYLEPEVWQHYMDSPRGAAVSRELHDRDWMRGALAYLGRYHQQFAPCLCHGDTHLGNLYEEPDGAPGFFDAQVARMPWQFEVTYHLICALDIADRRRSEQALLRHYLGALAAHGVDAPSFARAFEAYRREIVYGLFIFLINETRFQTEAVNTAYTARFGAAALDHDTVALTRA
jgi:Ecdysteroid kinase-like family